jgi:hypothetical protein
MDKPKLIVENMLGVEGRFFNAYDVQVAKNSTLVIYDVNGYLTTSRPRCRIEWSGRIGRLG